MPEQARKRRRLAISCTLCRRRKLRCNKETPCSSCLRSKNSICVYETNSDIGIGRNVQLAPAQSLQDTNTLLTPESINSSILNSSSSLELDTLKARIRELESQLSIAARKSSGTPLLTPKSTLPIPNRSVESVALGFGGNFDVIQDSSPFVQTQSVVRNVAHKNRVFGQSHWISSFMLFRDIIQMIKPCFDGGSPKLIDGQRKAKALARAIKTERSPTWPTPLTFEFPAKHICDELVEGYIRSIETLYRIIHIPTFREKYEAIWTSNAQPSPEFTVQLKLIMAIGACLYDENFSMRLEATRWVYEAQTWLSSPTFKSNLGLQFLQNNILLLLSREIVDVGGELIWISAGSLVRSAVYIGFHKDPTHLLKTSTFEIEMRRRVWNTILEISMQTSLVSGGIPFISLSDFTTEPPRNFDDEQLMADNPLARTNDEYTQTSIAIALRRTLPARLAVVKFLNDTSSTSTYEETLRIDTELRSRYKELKNELQRFRVKSHSVLSRFEQQTVDFITHRYLISLHIPYFESSLKESAYAFTRKVVIDSSLKVWSIGNPSSVSSAPQTPFSASFDSDVPTIEEDFPRLCRCGSGFFRALAFQASTLLVVELRTQLQEDDSIGTLNIRPDLLAVLKEAPSWYLRCIEAGETGVKGYLLHRILNAQIDGLIRNVGKDEMPAIMTEAAEDAGNRCLPLLENLRRQQQSGRTTLSLDDAGFEPSLEFMKDWDLVMSDVFDVDQFFT